MKIEVQHSKTSANFAADARLASVMLLGSCADAGAVPVRSRVDLRRSSVDLRRADAPRPIEDLRRAMASANSLEAIEKKDAPRHA